MEDKKIKEEQQIQNKNSQEINEPQVNIEKDIIIHKMPKRFLKSAQHVKNPKGIGALILIAGGIILIAGLFLAYYYLIDKNDSAEVKEAVKPVEQTPVQKTKPSPILENVGDQETTKKEPLMEIATSTKQEIEVATTSEPEATSSIPVIEVSTSTEEIVYKQAADSDQDGLADLEEILFDCNINAKDSDGDNYDDLSEILNLYNPTGGGSLMVNPNIEKYINSDFGYYVYYPYVWKVDNIGGNESIVFKIENNQFIQIIAQANPDKILLEDWYLEQMKIDSIDYDRKMYKKGWQAIKSDDNLTVYLAKPGADKIFAISYNLGASDVLNYLNIFNMMVKSFEAD